jgi:hypothetical protein
MTPEERQLVTGLFQRMRSFGAPQKDAEAAALIGDSLRTLPDAPYMLVQSVLAQEHALQEAGKRIEELERRLREAQPAAQREQSGAGSFLGGLLGGGRPVSEPASQPAATSVPPIGSRAEPAAFDDDNRRPRWTQSASASQAAPEPAGGGFMRSALATAAGVAGGMLAAGALGNLLGTNAPAQAANAPANPAANPAPAGTDAAVQQARQDWEDDVRADAEDTDWSDGGIDMGGDF